MEGSNKCIYIGSDNKLSFRELDETYKPSGGQALVKVEYSGVNPADLKHGQHLGLNDNVCGYEYCGIVIEAGPSSPFAVDEVIFGSNATGKEKPRYHGAHQDYMIVEPDHMSLKSPPNVPHPHAAVLSVMVRTAADAIFNVFGMSFPSAGIEGTAGAGSILIWGGASSVGVAAIQIAKAVGLSPILTTASRRHHERLLQLGATICFDYHDDRVVENIQVALHSSREPLKYCFDAVCTQGINSSTAKCEAIQSTFEVQYASTLPVFDNPRWKMAVAVRGFDFPPFTKAQPELEAPLRKATEWAARNYGKGFVIPHVHVVKGADAAIEAIVASATGKISFEKIAIAHPL